MRIALLSIIVFACGLFCNQVLAQQDKGWVGYKFAPQKCLKIQEGEFEVQRKLCNITYQITLQNNRYVITGHLSYNKKFVPKTPKRIELEILFIDDQFVCRKQINLNRQVEEIHLKFSVIADTTQEQIYIRTYYTLYYQ